MTGGGILPGATAQEVSQIREQLADVLDSMIEAFYAYDREWRFVRLNRAARARMAEVGLDAETIMGRVLWDVFPMTLGTEYERNMRHAMDARVPVHFTERDLHRDLWLDVRVVPTAEGVAAFLHDDTQRHRADMQRERARAEAEEARAVAERAAVRTARLQAVTSALLEANTPQGVAGIVLREAMPALGADAGFVSMRNESDRIELVECRGYPNGMKARYGSFALSAPYPAAEAARHGTPIWLESRADRLAKYPALAESPATTQFGSWAFLPLTVHGVPLGVISLAFIGPRHFDAEERALAVALAQQCAQALERARLFEAERSAHAAAEEAVDRIRRLQHMTAQLNRATDREEIADVIFNVGLATVGAAAGSLALVDTDTAGTPIRLRFIRSAGYAAFTMDPSVSYDVAPGRPLSEAVLRRQTVFISTREEWQVRFPDVSTDLTPLGFHAFAAVPVITAGRVLAALSFSFTSARTFDDATRTLLATLGEQCALALERERLHQAQLRHAEQQGALLNTIQDAFVAFDRELRYSYVNARAEALLGRRADELLGQRLDTVFPEAVGTPIYQAVVRTLAEGHSTQLEALSVVTSSWTRARIYPSPDGASLVFEDITARRRAQEAADFISEASRLLATSLDYETTLRALADAAVPRLGDWCAVEVIVDPTERAWPPRVERLAVVHRDPAILALGDRLNTEFGPDWTEDAGLPRVLRTGEPLFVPVITDAMIAGGARNDQHLELLRALQFTSVMIVPLIARDVTLGALTLCMTESGRHYDSADLSLATDLAQRAATAIDNARLFRDAERARGEAEAANHAKSQFLATMSHELRTPLNAIGGYAELLGMGLRGPVTPDQHADLDRIQRSQKHLLGLINEVLNYARLESGSIEYDLVRVSVGETLATVESLILPQSQAKGIEIGIETADPALSVWGDADKVRQILLNLLSNAVKFTDAGGRISIQARTRTAKAPALARDRSALPPTLAEISVSDTGVGIASDQLERIFEPFVQIGRALNMPGEGTGLGLSISRDLARGMGGNLTATSTLGQGSIFTLSLPAVV